MKTFKGKEILEVWDFRLSKGSPILYADGKTWVVKIFANNPGAPEYKEKPGFGTKILLAEHDTGVSTKGGVHCPVGVSACYNWLHSVRDDFSKEHIELRKPVTKVINASNKKLNILDGEAQAAKEKGETNLFHQKLGEAKEYLDEADLLIKKATETFHKQVSELVGGAA